MRIAYVCNDPGIPVYGRKGASVHVQELMRAYRGLGHEVVLVAARPGSCPPEDLVDIEVVDVGRAAIHELADRERTTADIDRKIERVVASLDVDMVHERYSLFGGGGIRAAALRGWASLLEVNAPLIDEQVTHRGLAHPALAWQRLRETAQLATTVTAVSTPVADWVAHHGGRDALVVPNGVNIARFTPTEPAGPFTVGFVGTLKPWHGVEQLARAMGYVTSAVPRARLLLVGDGPRLDQVLSIAADAGVEVVHTGAVDPTDVPMYLAQMHVACAPYPADAEAYFLPLKVLEYLAAGVPVVASAVGQLPLLLDYGRAGVLVPADAERALAGAITGLANDRLQRRRLALAGRQHVVDRYTWTHAVDTGLAAVAAPTQLAAGGVS